jgi:hypothetical protein
MIKRMGAKSSKKILRTWREKNGKITKTQSMRKKTRKTRVNITKVLQQTRELE